MPATCRYICTIAAFACLGTLAPAADDAAPSFNRDILPILSNNCFTCHGPDAPARKADLRLDHEEHTKQPLANGGTPIVSGNPSASLVIQRINATDPADRMPPPESGKTLSDTDRALLTRWIAAGATWQPHWAFLPPARTAPPNVTDTSWPRNPIDHFVLATLEAEGITPAPEADRHTLIRRVSLALTGLPPAPDDVQSFAQDTDPKAYEALVERLLASPRHGEHRARQWLDLARYADTNGYAADIERTMWRYRDWVIGAFNENMPFDQFTIEQLAGDLLPDPTLDQRIATGFNRNHPIMMEGGAIFEEYRVQNVVDRVDTTATTWLGLTMKCAQCHDHKYDPLSQREFYQFYAFFNSVTEEESRLFGTELDGNSLPRIPAPLPAQQEALTQLTTRLAAVRAEMQQPQPELDDAQHAWEESERVAAVERWIPLEFTPCSRSGEERDERELVLEGTTDCATITALRVELAPAADSETPFSLAELELYIDAPGNSESPTRIDIVESAALEGDAKPAHDGNPETAWHVTPQGGLAVFVPEAAIQHTTGTPLRIILRGDGISAAGPIRLSLSDDPAYLPAVLGPWRVNGPYVAESGDEALASAHVEPGRIDLNETDESGNPKWVAPEGGLPDGTMHALPGKTCATWLYRTITAPGPRTMDLALDNRNAVRLWINGRLVLDKEAQRGEVGPHPAPVNIELREGENSVLVKIVDYYDFNPHTFFFARKGEQIGPVPLDVGAALRRDPAGRTAVDTARIQAEFRRRHWDEWKALHEQELDLAWEKAELEKQVPTTMVMEDLETPRATHMLVRGEYDRPGDPVTPGTPAVLPTGLNAAPTDRLDLARWIVAPENPLTARVAVNRFWQHLFGEGLVRTPDDFGIQGERPSHPELLDWLAVAFIDSGWDMKAMQRLIVTSATFRQASRLRPELAERDPGNHLLARGPRYRLDAELIRDSALAASGLLVERLGGPSVKPYQPPGLWRDVAYGGGGQRYTAQEFIQDHGENLYRRSLYTFWKRAAAPPGMLVFDAPNRDICTARRSRSNTPLQALTLMNDTQYVEAARNVAHRIMTETGSEMADRIAHAALLILGRPPRPEEHAALQAQFESQRNDYRAAPEAAMALLQTGESTYDTTVDPVELAAWTLVANALMNTDAAVSQH